MFSRLLRSYLPPQSKPRLSSPKAAESVYHPTPTPVERFPRGGDRGAKSAWRGTVDDDVRFVRGLGLRVESQQQSGKEKQPATKLRRKSVTNRSIATCLAILHCGEIW